MAPYDAVKTATWAQNRRGPHAGEDFVGDAELAAGVDHNRGDSGVVCVADVGEQMMHHLQHAKIISGLYTGPMYICSMIHATFLQMRPVLASQRHARDIFQAGSCQE